MGLCVENWDLVLLGVEDVNGMGTGLVLRGQCKDSGVSGKVQDL